MADATRTILYKLLVEADERSEATLASFNKSHEKAVKERVAASNRAKDEELKKAAAIAKEVAKFDEWVLLQKLKAQGREATERAKQADREKRDRDRAAAQEQRDREKADRDRQRQEDRNARETLRTRRMEWRELQQERKRQEAEADKADRDAARAARKAARDEEKAEARAAAKAARDSARADRVSLAMHGREGRQSEADFWSVAAEDQRDRDRRARQAQADADEAARDRAQQQADRDRDARRASHLEESVIGQQINLAQKGLSSFTQLGRAATLAFGSQNEEMETAVRALANFETIAQSLGGVLDIIETGAQYWKLYRLEVEAATLAQKGLTAANVASSVAGTAASGAGAVASGGVMGSLTQGALTYGPLALPVAGIAALMASLQMPKGESREVAERREAMAEAAIGRRRNWYSNKVDALTSFGARPEDVLRARGVSARSMASRVSSDLIQDVESVDHWRANWHGLRQGEGWARAKRLVDENDSLSAADFRAAKEGAEELLKIEKEKQDLALEGIRKEMEMRRELISSTQSAYESAIQQRRSLEERIATGDPTSLALMKRAAAKADAGGELTGREAAAVRNIPGYEAIAQEAFSRIARKKAPGLFGKIDDDVDWRRASRDLAIDGAAGDARNVTKTIQLDAMHKIDVKMSLDEAAVADAFQPVIAQLVGKVNDVTKALASREASDRRSRQSRE